MSIQLPWNPLLGRRDALRIGVTGAVALAGLSSVRKALGQCTAAPALDVGPYWVDEMLNRSDIRSDPATGVFQAGFPLRLGITVSEITAGVCAPLVGAYVDLWHCNAAGVYSDESAQGTLGQKWLRGYQVTDAHGNVRFLTIYPGYYVGRTVHIHARVRKYSGATVTFNFVSQLFFSDTVTDGVFARVAPYNTRPARGTRNANDGIYGQGGSQMLLRLSDNISHGIASFNIKVNSIPGLVEPDATPMDPEADEHANDYGGGSPPVALEPVPAETKI